MTRLRIVSDGTSKETHVYTEDGVAIEGVTSVTWLCQAPERAQVVLTLTGVVIDAVGEYDETE